MNETTKYPQIEFSLLDLKDYDLPFFNEEKEALERRFGRLLEELLWFTDVLKVACKKS